MNKRVGQNQSNYSSLFHCVRWASFHEFVYHVNERITAILRGVKDVHFIQHIGGAYYISVTSTCHCVHLKILSTILLQGYRRQTHYDRTITTF